MCRVQISHLKVDSPSKWGASARALSMIDAASSARHRCRGGPVRLHRGQLDPGNPISVLGARGRTGRRSQAAERSGDWAKIKDEMRDLLAERGLSDLSFAVVASYRPIRR